MNVLKRALEEIESEKCLMTELLEDDEYRKGYIAGMTYAHGIASEYTNEVVTSQNKVVVDILNGLADWWHTEAPIDESEEKSETLKVLEQVQEYVESFLDEDVEKKSGWIPVSERLPKEDGHVLVTVNGRFHSVIFVNALALAEYDNVFKEWIIEGWETWENPNVTAWQPLPEPYEEESRS